jgi:hypothetical protein
VHSEENIFQSIQHTFTSRTQSPPKFGPPKKCGNFHFHESCRIPNFSWTKGSKTPD